MNLQKKTITRYRQFFPGETLRETSSRTGIQITRIFRLFGGKTMKVTEMESFEKAVSDKIAESPNFSRLNEVLEEASALLTNEELGNVTAYVKRKLIAKSYSRMYVRHTFNDAIIA